MRRIIQRIVRCPNCGATTTAAPGAATVCPHCHAAIYVPPDTVRESPWSNCVGMTEEANNLLRAVTSRPPTDEELALLTLLIRRGLIKCS